MPPRYSESDMQKALAEVFSGSPVTRAAGRWNIPATTLLYRSRGSTTRAAVSEGRQKLTRTQETHLSNWIVSQAVLGFPVNQATVHEFVKKVLERNGGLDKPLGRNWVMCFLRRHPEITSVKGILYPTADVKPDSAEVAVQAFQRQASAEKIQQSPKDQQSELEPKKLNELDGAHGPGVDWPQVIEPRESPAKPTPPSRPPQARSPHSPQEPSFVLITDPTPIRLAAAMQNPTQIQPEADTEDPISIQPGAAMEDPHPMHPGAIPLLSPLSP